jgi:hypothetical protein
MDAFAIKKFPKHVLKLMADDGDFSPHQPAGQIALQSSLQLVLLFLLHLSERLEKVVGVGRLIKIVALLISQKVLNVRTGGTVVDVGVQDLNLAETLHL